MSALRTLLELGGDTNALSLKSIYVFHSTWDTTEIVTQDVAVYGQYQQIQHGRPLKFGEQAETAAEYVAVCKAFQEVLDLTDVKLAK